MNELDDLRSRIRDLDERILQLVRERMDHAGRIGRIKKTQGVPLRDWQVERAVLDNADRAAAAIGLPRTLARGLMQLLIAESRVEQERQTYSEYTGAAHSILIIGGCGKMGRWFADFFTNQGHRVEVYDIAAPPTTTGRPASLETSIADASFALIATPLETVPAIIDKLAAARFSGVAFDIASLKGHLKPAIAHARDAGLAFTSIHPMFGPTTRALSDQVVCVCDCGHADATQKVRAFFSDTAVTLVDLSFDEHDRIASYVLGLSHLVNILFTRVLMQGGDRFEALNRVGSTTFHSQMASSGLVIQENPDLYYSIQRLNPFTPQLYEALEHELNALTHAVLQSDRQSFIELMSQGKIWLTGAEGG